MTLETLIAQLREAKAKNLILRATILPASVVIVFPDKTPHRAIHKLKKFIKDAFPHTTIQIWNTQLPHDTYNTICMSFTVDCMLIKNFVMFTALMPKDLEWLTLTV